MFAGIGRETEDLVEVHFDDRTMFGADSARRNWRIMQLQVLIRIRRHARFRLRLRGAIFGVDDGTNQDS